MKDDAGRSARYREGMATRREVLGDDHVDRALQQKIWAVREAGYSVAVTSQDAQMLDGYDELLAERGVA